MWEGISCNDQAIISPAARKEIRCLLLHIDKGCLSGILPGRGTNRNERLHKDLNAHMRNSRYGVELAYALLTSALFTHISAKRNERRITAYSDYHNREEIELFGLASHSRITECPQTDQHETSAAKVRMVDLDYRQTQEAIHDLHCGINDEEQTSIADVTDEEALTIFKQALSSFDVSRAIQKCPKLLTFAVEMCFLPPFLLLLREYATHIEVENTVVR